MLVGKVQEVLGLIEMMQLVKDVQTLPDPALTAWKDSVEGDRRPGRRENGSRDRAEKRHSLPSLPSSAQPNVLAEEA